MDKENKLVVTESEFETIKKEDFGGVLVGSKKVIKNNDSELVRYFVSKI
jgi:hypothetical protein